MHMTFACAMQISKASKEVWKACFRNYITISKKHVPGIGNLSIANTLLFFANRYVSIIIARSDTKPCFLVNSTGYFFIGFGVKGIKKHRWGQPCINSYNQVTHIHL